MEIPVTAGPWLVLGVVLGLLVPVLAVAVGLLGRSRGADAPPPAPDEPEQDDLPGFLASPPGSVPGPVAPVAAWPPLSSPPAAPPQQAAPGREDRSGLRLLATMAVGALLLIGAAAAVAAVRTPDRPAVGTPTTADDRDPARSSAPARSSDLAADLTFGGVVLERHAVGVTVARPRVRVTTEDGRTTATIELATFNCLRTDAPADPEAAGCTRSVTEVAELSTPQLDARRDGGGVRVSGAFATSRPAAGSAPVATGRVYDVVVTARPRDGESSGGRTPATGVLEVGGERVGSGDDGDDVLVRGG
ncbi:hypothetical protein [Blastococcus haudaquaticus]|nr:hypothetical protein [Blastococcus haudaquaticus]